MAPNPAYHVVAMSMPIVYTREGDHDPNGLLFTLKAHEPLLKWARNRWNDDGEFLPRLHERAQRIQLVVDNLELLNLMVPRLRAGSDADRELLAELLRREHVGDVPDPASDPDDQDDDDDGGWARRSAHERAVRQNVLRVVDDLRFALDQLAGAEVGGGVPEPDAPRLVSLTDLERAALLAQWRVQRDQAEAAIEAWLVALNSDPARMLDPVTLQQQSGLSADRIRRLLLNDHATPWDGTGARPYDRFNPLRPIPLVRPLVLRARVGEPIRVRVENQIRGRRLGFHVQGAGLGGPQTTQSGVRSGDGAHIGLNNDSTIAFNASRIFRFDVPYEGVWPINDLADVRGIQVGSNVHGLFGALVVEPRDTSWRDPETGEDLTFQPWGDGLYVDVLPPTETDHTHDTFVDFYSDDVERSFREYAVFMHDEPEIASGLHTQGEHSFMPLSYRAEPMPNRLPHQMRRLAELTPQHPPAGQTAIDRTAVARRLGEEFDEQFFIGRRPDGTFVERVAGEEQHHSSWLFGEPETPVLRAYKGDPARIRLVHGGVKETHVFHLHVHQWRAVPQDTAEPSVWGLDENGELKHKGSQLLDSITIGPQTGFDIDPLYGSGSRQHAVGDIIWHCHLYPHFHHGMWGLWRSFDRHVDGSRAYPDGTPCFPLVELPGRPPKPVEPGKPGFPWFIDGVYPQKSPPPPALRPEHVGGRRRLLEMGLHTQLELDAFDPAVVADPQPGVLFVDLDGLGRRANEKVGLAAPHRVIHYDVEVLAADAKYNRQGWHDPTGHYYRLLRVQVRDVDDTGAVVAEHPELIVDHRPDEAPVPFFPRANHGDLVELTLYNSLGSFPADRFDLGQLPAECALHVHLVKFDPLAADGSSTGWNYLSGASSPEAVGPNAPGQPPRNTSLHRWVVDEEFGPCFFHDHLLANYRQKHGLFAALIAEPPRSQWHTADQEDTAWDGAEAVVVPPTNTGVSPFRDFCLAVGDFVPLLDQGGRPLNPPGELGGFDDPGSMAVNYRSAPLTFRGPDPSTWFTTQHDSPPEDQNVGPEPEVEGEVEVEVEGPVAGALPDTPTIRSYPGERLRIRLIQGSHEEQHSFVMHGMRWPREWHNPRSVLINQQTLGISEVFTLDVDPAARSPYGLGDHLWRFNNIDDTWLGCWGLWRVALPGGDPAFPPLPALVAPEMPVPLRAVDDRPPANDPAVRTFVVVARRTEHRYAENLLTDPWGLIYHHAAYDQAEHDLARDTGEWRPTSVQETGEPLVLRARRGEWVRLFLVNEVRRPDDEEDPNLPRFGVEPSPPVLPLEHVDDLGRPDRRTVARRVSLHPSLLRYDVVSDDGAYVGVNRDGTVAPLADDEENGSHDEHGGDVVDRDGHALGHLRTNWIEYWWYADEALAPAAAADGPGQVCLLEDLADVRNHRHHGLFGALVVEPPDLTPFRPGSRTAEAWWGTSADLCDADGDLVAYEGVLFVQDGLRLFVNGHPDQPMPDVVPGDDPEDSGQKGFSYRAVPIHRGRPPLGANPGTPILSTRAGDQVWLRLVGAGDKPRNHSLTVHGVAWQPAPWVPGGWRIGAASGVSNGWAETVVVNNLQRGDHAIRSGAFRWGTEQGIWALLRGL
ncbi:multicopper oxidase domain-containing protein [Actinomycetospora lutea]|uniref:multicopper oxidase domain-containing protein n=1 Tax=Actinomycetospora lutea TaxID=663604 RepID=UPI00236726BD|nr:multicopper oxidase domain-containing protein [Actinomycetospora lutea]MDD7942864.1 multicopper oxidase domain-containing protein [Actinomycetospora lutea]